MASDPADIRRAPKQVVIAVVEYPFEGFLREQVIACSRVFDSFRFAGRATRVKDEERGFAIERFSGATGRGYGHKIVPPVVAARLHVDRESNATQHDTVLDRRRF